MDYINEMLDLQKELDFKIFNKFEVLPHETFDKRIVATLAELFEFANEEKSFKYWTENKEVNYDKALTEYIDILHFLLSLANTINFDLKKEASIEYRTNTEDLIFDFTRRMIYFHDFGNPDDLLYCFNVWQFIGILMGFSDKEIFDKYKQKNQENLNRLERGY